MTTRTTRKTVTFRRPFSLSAVDEVLPPGTYAVDTDEELIDGLSFLAYRCIATLLHLPCISNRGVSEVVVIDPSPDQIPQAAIDLWPPHPISRNMIGPVRHTVPGSLRSVRLRNGGGLFLIRLRLAKEPQHGNYAIRSFPHEG